MKNISAITLRIPYRVKKVLHQRAEISHRSLSAEALNVIEHSLLANDSLNPGTFLGMFSGSLLPTEQDIQKVRSELWSYLKKSQS